MQLHAKYVLNESKRFHSQQRPGYVEVIVVKQYYPCCSSALVLVKVTKQCNALLCKDY